MDNLNYLFYEEFTKLDQMCVSIYQMENGVVDYLDEMAGISSACFETVPHWQMDLEQLYRYRVIYAALAQSTDAFHEALCNQEDIAWLREFYTRIMERRDPLALLQERGYRAEDDAIQRLEDDRACEIVIQAMNPRDRYVNGPFAVWVIVIAVILTCLISILVLSQL